MTYGITLIILGILAAPSLLLSKKPNAQELLDKIAPYQGWIGLVFCLWGVWGVINALLNLSVIKYWPIWWITWIACSAIMAVLGFILGYRIINKYILSGSEGAKKKGEEVLNKLVPLQGKLGLIAIIFGVWVIISNIVFLG